jgi:hypothetical protein
MLLKPVLPLLFVLCASASIQAEPLHYAQGSVIAPEAVVSDSAGSVVSLRTLLAQQDSKVNVLFVFGGGDLGFGMPGHLWCPDSFEDTSILRTLVGKYAGKGVDFVAVASAPVYHSQVMKAPARVFLDEPADSDAFLAASKAFIESTQAARTDGILPLDPYFDLRFALMLNRSENQLPGAGYGELADWHGAFRAAHETQFYGVPGFWLVSDAGEILAEPFRGNVYHPHGAEVNINYTFSDIDAALSALLDAQDLNKN